MLLHSANHGVLLRILYKLIITVYALLMISISAKYSIIQLCFVLDITSLLLITPIVIALKIDMRLNISSVYMYLGRTFFNCLGMVLWILSLNYIGGNDTSAIAHLTPIFTLILVAFFYNEKPSRFESVAILIALLGSTIILAPSFKVVSVSGPLVSLASSLTWACYDIVCKHQTKKEHYLKQAFYSFLFSSLSFMPFALYQFQPMNLDDILQIPFMALLTLINIIFLFLSYKFTPVSLLVPVCYLDLVFMAVGSYFFLGEILSTTTIIGSCFLMLSTAMVLHKRTTKSILH